MQSCKGGEKSSLEFIITSDKSGYRKYSIDLGLHPLDINLHCLIIFKEKNSDGISRCTGISGRGGTRTLDLTDVNRALWPAELRALDYSKTLDSSDFDIYSYVVFKIVLGTPDFIIRAIHQQVLTFYNWSAPKICATHNVRLICWIENIHRFLYFY